MGMAGFVGEGSKYIVPCIFMRSMNGIGREKEANLATEGEILDKGCLRVLRFRNPRKTAAVGWAGVLSTLGRVGGGNFSFHSSLSFRFSFQSSFSCHPMRRAVCPLVLHLLQLCVSGRQHPGPGRGIGPMGRVQSPPLVQTHFSKIDEEYGLELQRPCTLVGGSNGKER